MSLHNIFAIIISKASPGKWIFTGSRKTEIAWFTCSRTNNWKLEKSIIFLYFKYKLIGKPKPKTKGKTKKAVVNDDGTWKGEHKPKRRQI